MENEVYEKDYSADVKPFDPQCHDTDQQLFDHIMESDFFEKFDSAMRALPKVVVAKDKEAYEDLLPRLDNLAKQWGGKIKGVVDYERWEASITVSLPSLEFSTPDDFALLSDIAAKTNLVTIKTTENGNICLNILINYFEEIGDTDGAIASIIQQDDKLVELLGKKQDEEKAALLSNPVVASFLEREAADLGITAEEAYDRFEKAFYKDPEGFMNRVFGSMDPGQSGNP